MTYLMIYVNDRFFSFTLSLSRICFSPYVKTLYSILLTNKTIIYISASQYGELIWLIFLFVLLLYIIIFIIIIIIIIIIIDYLY